MLIFFEQIISKGLPLVTAELFGHPNHGNGRFHQQAGLPPRHQRVRLELGSGPSPEKLGPDLKDQD